MPCIAATSLVTPPNHPLPRQGLARLRRRYGFLLVVDDAHATLVAGPHGGGTAEMQRAAAAVDATVGTLSKAFGCLGGFAACSSRLRALLLNRGRGVVFSTAPPLPVVAAARAALRVSQRCGAPLDQPCRACASLSTGAAAGATNRACHTPLHTNRQHTKPRTHAKLNHTHPGRRGAATTSGRSSAA